MTDQLDMFTGFDAGLCCYGNPLAGATRQCSRPATHRACWHIPADRRDGAPNTRAGSGGVDCCRDHANYYATAWCPPYLGMSDSAWIDVLA